MNTRMATLVVAVTLTISACGASTSGSEEATATAPGSPSFTAPSASTAASMPGRVELPDVNPNDSNFKDGWNLYGGVLHTGCGGVSFRIARDATAVQVFRPESGSFWRATKPAVKSGEVESRVQCALAGSPQNPDLVWLQQVTVPAQGLNPETKQVRVSIQKVGSGQIERSGEIASKEWVGVPHGTVSSVMIFGDGPTIGIDLATLKEGWAGPKHIVQISPNAVLTKVAKSSTNRVFEMWSPAGRMLAASPDGTGDDSDPKSWFDSESEAFTTADGVFDVQSKVFHRFDKNLLGHSTTIQAVVLGKVFLKGPTVAVIDVRTGLTEFSIQREQVTAARIFDSFYFDAHLYLINRNEGAMAYSVTTLPDRKEIATSWTRRPVSEMQGWTYVAESRSSAVCDKPGAATGDCIGVLIRNKGGKYPGPWY